eukprot:g349.t1
MDLSSQTQERTWSKKKQKVKGKERRGNNGRRKPVVPGVTPGVTSGTSRKHYPPHHRPIGHRRMSSAPTVKPGEIRRERNRVQKRQRQAVLTKKIRKDTDSVAAKTLYRGRTSSISSIAKKLGAIPRNISLNSLKNYGRQGTTPQGGKRAVIVTAVNGKTPTSSAVGSSTENQDDKRGRRMSSFQKVPDVELGSLAMNNSDGKKGLQSKLKHPSVSANGSAKFVAIDEGREEKGGGDGMEEEEEEEDADWITMAAIMVCEVIGNGVLSLSIVPRTLGYIPAVIVIVFSYFPNYFTSMLILQIRNKLLDGMATRGQPVEVKTMSDAAFAAFGQNTGVFWFAHIMTYAIYGLLSMTSYTLVIGTSLSDIVWGVAKYQLCMPLGQLLTGAWLIPLCCYIRNLKGAFIIAVINFVLILTPIILALVEMQGMNYELKPEDKPELFASSSEVSFLNVMGAFASTMFAYCGQWMYFEVLNEMGNNANDFPKCFWLTGPIQVLLYIVAALYPYHIRGKTVEGYLLANMEDGWMKTVASLCLYLHMCITYLIVNIVVHSVILRMFKSISDQEDIVPLRTIHQDAELHDQSSKNQQRSTIGTFSIDDESDSSAGSYANEARVPLSIQEEEHETDDGGSEDGSESTTSSSASASFNKSGRGNESDNDDDDDEEDDDPCFYDRLEKIYHLAPLDVICVVVVIILSIGIFVGGSGDALMNIISNIQSTGRTPFGCGNSSASR